MINKYNPIEDCYATKKKIYIFKREIEKYCKINKEVSLLAIRCGNSNDCGKFIINNFYEYNNMNIHQESIEYASHIFSSKNIKFSLKKP